MNVFIVFATEQMIMPTTMNAAPLIATQRRPTMSERLPTKGHTQACMLSVISSNFRIKGNEPMRASCPERAKSSDQRRQCRGKCMVVHLRKGKRESAIRSILYGIVSGVTTPNAGKTGTYRKPWRQCSSYAQKSSSAPPHGPRHHPRCVHHSSRSSLGCPGRARLCGLARRVPCRRSLLRRAEKSCCLDLVDQHLCASFLSNGLT